MFFGRYGSHIIKCPFHGFWKILILYYQSSVSCFSRDIDWSHDRYWSCIQIFKNIWDWSSGLFGPHLFENVKQELSFHFWKILVPYSRLSKKYYTELRDCSVPVFSNSFKSISQTVRFLKMLYFKHVLGYVLELFWISWSKV